MWLRVILAEVNEQAPWTFGSRTIAAEDIDLIVHTSRPPLGPPATRPSALERAVAVRRRIDRGCATLQCGLGSLPAAILMHLTDRRDLGVTPGVGRSDGGTRASGVITTRASQSIRARPSPV